MSAQFEKEYFDTIYNAEYDRRNPTYKFRSYFRELRPFAKGDGKLLDIGCAYGSFLKQVSGSFDLYGSDISNHAIGVARERIPSAKLFVSDVLNLPEDNRFNVITCFDILEHVPEIGTALAKIKSLLETDGILVISVPVYDTLIGSLVGKLDKDPTHVHKNSRYWWLDIIRKAGLDIVHWRGIWRYYVRPVFYLHYCSTLTRSFTPAILIVSRKSE